jgi:MFS family permease
VGNGASASGTWFQNLAGSIYVFRETHSVFLLGVLNFSQFIPILVLAPWAGAAADRFDRRRLLLITQTVSAALSGILAVLAWSDLVRVWVVIVFSGLIGIGSAFSSPAQTALVASLVPREDVAQAVALNSMTFNLARAVGPASATGVIALFGIPAAFAVNSLSFLVLVAALVVIAPRPYTRGRVRVSPRGSFSLVRGNPRLLLFLLMGAAACFASDPVNTESPALAHAFGMSDTWAGALPGLFGAGGVAAALLSGGSIGGSSRRAAMRLGLLGVGVALFASSPSFVLGVAFLALGGFGYLSSNSFAMSRLQLDVEDSQRGRMMALWSVAFLGLRPVASLADGSLATTFGVRVAAATLAVPALVVAALAARRLTAHDALDAARSG